MPRKVARCVVTGRVQGVFFRASTAERAQQLGIAGWVKNQPDGSVEVVAAGEEDAVASLSAWLWEGPPASRVASVSVEEWLGEVPSGFRVL